MNKKNLSVVMAGAMLATSVAPVLAAETTISLPESISVSNSAILKQNIKTLMESAKIENDNRVPGSSEAAGQSIYGVQILNKDGNPKSIENADADGISYTTASVEKALGNLREGDTVKVYERAHTEFLGKYTVSSAPEVSTLGTYSDTDIENIVKLIKNPQDVSVTNKADYTGLVVGTSLNGYIVQDSELKATTNTSGKKTVTFKLKALQDSTNETSNRTVTITEGDDKLNFKMALGKDGEKDVLLTESTSSSLVTKDVQECTGFYKDATYKATTPLTGKATEKSSTKITAATDAEKNTYLASELYDGFALTAAGTEIAELVNNTTRYNTTYTTVSGATVNSVSDIKANEAGVAELTIDVKNRTGNTTDSIRKVTVYSTNIEEVKALYNLLKGTYNVGVIGGANRYETAVNVSKAQGVRELAPTKVGAGEQNIVLVNGSSLVDGLAAAPLAAKLGCYDLSASGTKASAPVLLSESEKLPTATKEYLNDLTKGFTTTAKSNITVTLVGGKSVLSDAVKAELEGMGFTVKRLGGDNREETSLKVAKEVGMTNGSFVVGANGEADAMSISPVASRKVAPIIVSSVHGLSDNALEFVSEYKDEDYTVIGGESAVSKAEIDKLSDVTGYDVERVAGDNRFETNAKIIDKYYGTGKTFASPTGVVAVKDGQAKKSDLIDALSAANYAMKNNAPIVLASKDVKDVQKNALLNNLPKSTGKVIQVGEGAEPSVIKTLSELLNIVNIAK